MANQSSLLSRAGKAFGEFVLIFVGVLVALTVDQWAESNREDELEAHYLARLLDDVSATARSLRISKDSFLRADITSRFLDSILSEANGNLPDAGTLYIATQGAYRWFTPSYTRTTLDEMESIGGLQFLEDWDLRRAVISFYEWEETHEDLWENMDNRLRNVLRGVQYPSTDERFFNDCAPEVHPADCPVDIPGIEAEEIWNRLRLSPDINGMLRQNIRDVFRAQELLEDHLQRAEDLIARLEVAQVR
jgi:hypothetical protein